MRDGVGSGEVTVAIPTYQRVPYLERCLRALAAQSVHPAEVVVACRETDEASVAAVARQEALLPFPVRVARVRLPGFVPAFAAAALAAHTDIVAVIDDDAVVPPLWVVTISEAFRRASPSVGVLCGPVLPPDPSITRDGAGSLTWYGRFVTRFELQPASDSPEEIAMFCEGNVAFRRDALSSENFDFSLPAGRVLHHGLDIALSLIREGWTIQFVPALRVLHTPVRKTSSSPPSPEECAQYVRLMTYILRKHRGPLGVTAYVLYTIVAGQREAPGLLRALSRRDTRWSSVGTTAAACFRSLMWG